MGTGGYGSYFLIVLRINGDNTSLVYFAVGLSLPLVRISRWSLILEASLSHVDRVCKWIRYFRVYLFQNIRYKDIICYHRSYRSRWFPSTSSFNGHKTKTYKSLVLVEAGTRGLEFKHASIWRNAIVNSTNVGTNQASFQLYFG